MPGAPFTDRIRSLKSAVENIADPATSDIPFRSNIYYRQVVDLRPVCGIDAFLHFNARQTGTHKIQLIESGKKHYGEIADTIAGIVEEHPDLQAVARVDSCVDIADGPEVKWMVQSIRAKWAQWQAQFGNVELQDAAGKKMPWSEMGKREVKTMYMGKRPNCFRVYDKLAERYGAWQLEKRRHRRETSRLVLDGVLSVAPESNGVKEAISEGGKKIRNYYAQKLLHSWNSYERYLDKQTVRQWPPRDGFPFHDKFVFPDFPEWFAGQCSGAMEPLATQMPKVLTRVERQMGAGRVPDKLSTLEKVFSKEALDFNPFDRLQFRDFEATTEISPTELLSIPTLRKGDPRYTPRGLRDFSAGMQMRHWLEEGMPYQELYSMLNRTRNADRLLKKFRPYLATVDHPKAAKITAPELFERYRDSLIRQMAA